jgi:hypothetical protein
MSHLMMKKLFLPLAALLILSACANAPPTESSRQMLQEKFGNQSIDRLLTAWGPPMGETHLTDGTRLVMYTYTDIYDLDAWNQSTYTCKASFLAPPPSFKITKVKLEGDDYECHELSLGHTGASSVISPRASLFSGRFRDE